MSPCAIFSPISYVDALLLKSQITRGSHEGSCHGPLMLRLFSLSPQLLRYQRPYVPCPQAARLTLKAAAYWA